MVHKYLTFIVLCGLLPLSIMANNEISASLFAGHITYTIPIYTLEDPDFHLDVALCYQSKGFKPFQPSGCYGQDWSLKAGGYITRLVQGFPDDQRYGFSSHDSIVGMSRALQEGNKPDKEDVFLMNTSVYDTCGVLYYPDIWTRCVHKVDYMPDIYYFNFCGYQGRFIINNEGKAVIISGDFVRINLAHMKDYNIFPANTNYIFSLEKPYIEIQTTDGYTFVFGGSANALEFSVQTKRGGNVENQQPPAVTTWQLTKITAPNGRMLSFNYASGYLPYTSRTKLHSFVTDYDWSGQNVNEDSTHIIYTLHKESLLQYIQTSDSIPLRIDFCSSEEAFKMYEHNDFQHDVCHLKLDSIIVSYDEDTLQVAKMSYQYVSYDRQWGAYPNYHWRNLHQVSISGTGKYTMTYDDVDPNPGNSPFPIYQTHYPSLYPKTDSAYISMVDRFGFWKVSPLQNMLKEVSLPTGGKLRFTYGQHQYSKERRFCIIGTQDIVLYTKLNANQTIGGARIEKVETFSDDTTLVETKTYSYTEQGSDNSSGIFYNIYEVFYLNNPNDGYPITNPYNYGMIDSHIGYSRVLQTTTTSTQNYMTGYTFDTGIQAYDTYTMNGIIHRDPNNTGDTDTELRSGSLTYYGYLRITGKLISTDQYSGTTLVKSTRFKYNGIPNTMNGVNIAPDYSLGNTDTIVCLSTYSANIARKLIVCPDVLEMTATYEYGSGSEQMVSATAYTYDAKFRKKKEVSEDSRNILRFTKYTYPDDIKFFGINVPPSQYPGLYWLQLKYQINKPVEIISGYLGENDAEYVTAGTIHLYATGIYYQLNTGEHIFPTETIPSAGVVCYPYLCKTLTLPLSEPISDYQPMSAHRTSVTYDSNYRTEAEYTYNGMRQLISVKPFGMIETKYTWQGNYPATKSIGNQTWTYTYKPYVGLKSVTDPRGITTYYEYDRYGRLIEEYQKENGKKQILHVYQYHIKTE